MDAGKRTISDIFNGNRKLIIPFFQRTYVWKEEQWSRLVEDMEYISSTGNDYFLGSIILKSHPTPSTGSVGDIRTVIDGQQRLTTIAIFMKVLGLKTNQLGVVNRLFTLYDGSIAMQHSQGDSDAFNKVMNLTELEDLNPNRSNILNAYCYFKERIDKSKLNIQKIMDKAQFVGIDLLPTEDEQQIFDTINSLGVKLTTGELLKNYFFSHETIAEYNLMWKPAFELDEETREFWEQDVTAGRNKRSNIEAFLSAYLQIKVQNPNYAVRAEDKVMFRRSDGLFNNYKLFINNYVVSEGMDNDTRKHTIDEFIYDITEYAKIYRNSFNANALLTEVGAEPSLERMNIIIYGLDGTTVIPYLMFLQKNVDDDSEKKKIYEYLESYLMRRLVCKTHNNNYSDLFTENLIGNDIRTFEALKDYIEKKDPGASLAMPSNLMVRKAFHNEVMPNKRATGVLYMLESKLRDPALCSTAMLGFNSYSLEHLMPKNWRKKWGICIDPDNRDYTLLTLGNLAIITSSLNSAIRDAEWSKKIEGASSKGGLKKHAAGLVTMEAVLSSADWDEDHISERAYWLADKANEIWPSYSAATDDVDEETLESTSGSTSVEDIPTPQRTRNTETIDKTTFSINGSQFLKKGAFVRAFIKLYMEKHPEATYADLKRFFTDSLMDSGYKFIGLLATVEEWNRWRNENKLKRYYVSAADSIFVSADGVQFYVNTQWTLNSVKKVIELAEREGFSIESQR